jgi:WD40 repeat protein
MPRAFSPDGERLLTGGRDRTARPWETATGRLLFELPAGDARRVLAAAFNSDGQTLLTGSTDEKG